MKKSCRAQVAGQLLGVAVALGGALACGDSSDTGFDETGVLLLRLGARPADARCLVVEVASGGRTIERQLDINDDGPFRVAGLPAADAELNVSAYPSACAELTPASAPSWLSDPANLVVQLLRGQLTIVSVTMRPSAAADLDLIWADDTAVSACPGEDDAIDLDGNGVSDCLENLLENGQMTSSIQGWNAAEGFEVEFTSADANGSSQSGALRLTNTLTSEAPNGMLRGPSQCVAVQETRRYLMAARAFIPSGQGVTALEGDLFLQMFEAPGCAGPQAFGTTVQGVVFTDSWQHVQMQIVMPAGMVSARMGVGVMKHNNEGDPGTVIFDDVLAHVVP